MRLDRCHGSVHPMLMQSRHNVSHASDSIDDIVHCFPGVSTSTEPVSTRETESSMRALSLLPPGRCDWQDYALRPPPRKTTALFTRSRGFNSGIQREVLVWKAIPSITLIMSAIFFEYRRSHASFSLRHPPLCRRAGGVGGTLRQLRGLAGVIGVLLTVAVSCSMLAAVSSSADACVQYGRKDRCCPPQFHGYRHSGI